MQSAGQRLGRRIGRRARAVRALGPAPGLWPQLTCQVQGGARGTPMHYLNHGPLVPCVVPLVPCVVPLVPCVAPLVPLRTTRTMAPERPPTREQCPYACKYWTPCGAPWEYSPIGGTKTPKQNKSAPFWGKTSFSEPQRKKSTPFSIFLTPHPRPDPDPWLKMALRPPKPPISRAPSGAHWVRIYRAIKFGWWAFCPKWPLRPGKSNFLCFWPPSGPRAA